ncbi:MAG: hypothetical protein IT545_08640 [Rhodobacteraceae bacterium]|nr:hypothetical protein [Paracoccaceae bacterium]
MMHRHPSAFAVALALALALAPALPAAGEEAAFRLGGDAYLGAERAELTQPAADAFLAGETARVAAPLTGSAHLVGRSVAVAAEIGGNAYAAGYEVRLEAPVRGGASLAGYAVEVLAPVGGNLRAVGRRVRLAAPVAGAAALAGEEVRLEAPVTGDVNLSAGRVEFGEGARLEGRLTLVHPDPEAVEIPASVSAADRVTRIRADAIPGDGRPRGGAGWWWMVRGALGSLAALAVVTGLLALVAPEGMASLRRHVAERPFRAAWLGFLALSALAGAGLVVALTVVGILLLPAALALAALAAVLG